MNGKTPAFARPLGFTKHGVSEVSTDSAGLTKNEYAKIAFAAALMTAPHVSMAEVLIAAENYADQMFPTK